MDLKKEHEFNLLDLPYDCLYYLVYNWCKLNMLILHFFHNQLNRHCH